MGSIMKRLSAMFIALAFAVVGMGATAAYADTSNYNKTLSLTGLASGETVHVYKLMSYGDDYNTYVYYGDDSASPTGFAAFLDGKRGTASRDDYLKNLDATGVAEMLDRYVASDYAKPDATDYTLTGSEQDVVLEPGYYMFTVSTTGAQSNMYKPFSAFVKVDGSASTVIAGSMTQASTDAKVTVSMKSEQGPSIVKKVRRDNGTDMDSSWKTTKTVTIGETITYRVAVTIPDWKDIYNPGLTLIDELTNQEYVKDSVAIHTSEGDATTRYFPTGDLQSGAVSEKEIGEYAAGSQSVEFTIDYSKLTPNATYYITYKTKVMNDITGTANTGSTKAVNSAELQYNTSQSTTSQTTASATTLYTYAAKLTKQDANSNLLSGSKFAVYTDESCSADNQVKFTQVTNSDGSWYYRPDSEGTITDISTGGDGEYFLIKGLDPYKTYYFKETTTPAGYYAPKGSFKLTLQSLKATDDSTEHTGNLDVTSTVAYTNEADKNLVSGSVNGTQANQFDIVIKNSSTPSLPTTGGMGTVLFTVAGIALMAVAVGAFLFMRRRHQH